MSVRRKGNTVTMLPIIEPSCVRYWTSIDLKTVNITFLLHISIIDLTRAQGYAEEEGIGVSLSTFC